MLRLRAIRGKLRKGGNVRRRLVVQAVFWIATYIALAIAPLVLLKLGEVPPGREYWRELSVALGFAGLTMLTLQFALTARFRSIKAPYGADVIYHFHRQISLVTFGLILVVVLLFLPSLQGLVSAGGATFVINPVLQDNLPLVITSLLTTATMRSTSTTGLGAALCAKAPPAPNASAAVASHASAAEIEGCM